MKTNASRVALLGDVVGSRSAPDRRRLHGHLVAALAAIDARCPARESLRVTVGDEFQGVYDSLGAALDAALRIRLALLPAIDVRIGLGRGEIVTLDADRGLQDGPAWWSARAALERVEAGGRRSALRTVRTGYAAAAPDQPDDALGTAVNAALACQDHLVESLSDRSRRLLVALLEGRTQAEVALAEGISASAVSQLTRRHGLGVILHAHDELRRLP